MPRTQKPSALDELLQLVNLGNALQSGQNQTQQFGLDQQRLAQQDRQFQQSLGVDHERLAQGNTQFNTGQQNDITQRGLDRTQRGAEHRDDMTMHADDRRQALAINDANNLQRGYDRDTQANQFGQQLALSSGAQAHGFEQDAARNKLAQTELDSRNGLGLLNGLQSNPSLATLPPGFQLSMLGDMAKHFGLSDMSNQIGALPGQMLDDRMAPSVQALNAFKTAGDEAGFNAMLGTHVNDPEGHSYLTNKFAPQPVVNEGSALSSHGAAPIASTHGGAQSPNSQLGALLSSLMNSQVTQPPGGLNQFSGGASQLKKTQFANTQ